MRFLALITLLVYVWFLSKPLVHTVDFIVNQEEIADERCENKNKPVLACNGKCYLMKTLQEDKNPFETEMLDEEPKKENKDKNNQNKKNAKVYEVLPNQLVFHRIYKIPTKKNFKPYFDLHSTMSVSLDLPPPKA